MKVRTIGAILTTLLVGATVTLSGCATTGSERAMKTTQKMQNVENDMKQAIVQVDQTSAALDTLTKPDQVALKKAFDEYKDNVDKMEKVGKQVERHDSQMRAQGKEYFSEWEKRGETYTDPNLRQASAERRDELSQIYNKVPQATSGMKQALDSYLTQIQQIETYLSNDLTPKGIEAMTPAAKKAIEEGERLKAAVQPVITAMDQATQALTQGSTGAAAGGTQR